MIGTLIRTDALIGTLIRTDALMFRYNSDAEKFMSDAERYIVSLELT
jgi:hypothetical protein